MLLYFSEEFNLLLIDWAVLKILRNCPTVLHAEKGCLKSSDALQ